LGTVPNYEEAKNNYDSVRIDLSKTSGVDLNISNLLVSNPNDEGIIITASKGADNITLVAGANHDIVEFAAGTGSSTGAREVYTVDLNNLRLGNNQSFSIDGLTISNVEGGIVRAAAIAQAIAAYVNNPSVQPSGFNITGKLGSLTGDWAGAAVTASGGKLVITSTLERNIKDLALSFTGNDSTNAPANITAQIVAGASAASSSITGLIETSPAKASADAKVTDSTVVFDATQALGVQINNSATSGDITINGETYNIKLTETASNNQTATGAQVAEILNTGALTTAITGVTIAITDSNGNAVTAADYAAAVSGAGITFAPNGTTATNIELSVAADSKYSGDVTINDGSNDSTWTITPAVEAAAAKPEIGTPESVSGSSFVWSPKALNGAVTSPATIFSMDIDGNKFSVEATTTAGTTEITVGDVIAIINSGNVSGIQGGITYNTKLGNATAPRDLKTVLDSIGVQVTTTPAGIAGNQIVFEKSSSDIPEGGARFSISAGTAFANSTTTAQWSAQPAAGIPAQAGTHEVSINGHTITFADVFLSAVQVRDAVFELVTKGTLSALISEGTLPSDIASKVSIDNQAYSPANAKATVASFAIAGGVEYLKDGVAGIKLSDPTASNTVSSEIVFSQTNTADGEVVAEQIYNLVGAHGDEHGQISINFNALKAGQSYTFDGKTIIATKDLSANQVANAFTLTTDDTVDGAVVVSDFENIDNEGVLFYVANNSGNLIIQGTADAIIPEGIDTTITGTGALGVNTSGVSASTTQQGFDGSGTKADSYVIFATTSAEDGTITAVNANTAFVDSITNFDVGNDGLRLRDSEGGYYGQNNIGTIGNLASIAVGDTTLTANAVAGVISFGTLGETTAAITLDQKLYVATHSISNNRVAGFEHEGDFYVVATGASNDSNVTTDDIVVRLAGVTGVADISTVLA
ncbi:MAG: hypothetical protein K2N70_00765, partial [Helicobacter sp.]|nr:hypothetical protein [Helicobacter sp.]